MKFTLQASLRPAISSSSRVLTVVEPLSAISESG